MTYDEFEFEVERLAAGRYCSMLERRIRTGSGDLKREYQASILVRESHQNDGMHFDFASTHPADPHLCLAELREKLLEKEATASETAPAQMRGGGLD